MGKLSVFMAMKRDLAFEYERELRAVRNLIQGITRVSGSEYTIELAASEGFVAGSRARAAFVEGFGAAVHQALIRYAHDLARECLEHGMDQETIGGALGGSPARTLREQNAQTMPQQAVPLAAQQATQSSPGQPIAQPIPMAQPTMTPDASVVRLAACA